MSRYGCLTAFLLVTCAQSQVLNISVEDAGVDEPTCIHGDTPCHTLDYVLLSLSNTTCVTLGAATAYIDVRTSQNVLPSKYNFNCPLSLFISGNGEVPPFGPPALTCLTEDRLTLSSQTAQRSVAVHWQSLSFVNCAGPDSYGLSLLSFNECLVINSRGCVIVDTETVQIQSSKYTFGRSAVGAASFLFVSHVRLAQVYITNTTFATTCTNSSQWVTSVWLVNSTVHIQGHITFENNTGILGGALRLTRSQIVADDDASVQFINNFAQFGSAVYIEEASCPLLNISNGHSIFTFQKNAIGGAGQSQVYMDAPPLHLSTCLPDSSLYDVSFDTGQRQVSTSAVKMSVALPPGFSVIPGKSILLTVNITDYFHAPVACAAAVYFVRTMGEEDAAPNLCNDPRNGIELVCPFVLPQMPRSSEVLISSEFFNSTLSLKSSVQPINSTNITIGFVCNNNASAAVSFSLRDCPPFTTYFNNATRSCECKKPRVLETHFLCSVEEEVACVEKGYWVAFENATTPLVAPCGFPYCKDFPSSCPLTDNSNFVLLDDSPDDQCLGNSGGLLCRGCGRGYYPTFPPMRCVKTCSLSVSIALLFIAMTIQVAKVIFTNVLFSINKGTGKESDKETEAKTEAVLARPDPLNFAYFYGPLFCLSFLRRLPFQYLSQFQHLNVAVSIYRTLVLPVLDVVGDIPWCFFPEIGTLGVFSFNYFAPLLAYLIFGILYAMRRLCARNKPGPKPSGLRSLSLLILLSFWSLSFTSIGILKGMQIGGLQCIS